MSSENDVALFFQAYAAAFTACDVEAIGDLWVYPALLTAGERSAAYADVESFNENTSKLCEFYKSQGVEQAKKEVLGIEELYPTVVQARTRDRVLDSNGGVVAEWEHVYLLRQYPDGWKAITAIADGEVEAWNRRGTNLGSSQPSGS